MWVNENYIDRIYCWYVESVVSHINMCKGVELKEL